MLDLLEVEPQQNLDLILENKLGAWIQLEFSQSLWRVSQCYKSLQWCVRQYDDIHTNTPVWLWRAPMRERGEQYYLLFNNIVKSKDIKLKAK